MILKCLSLSLTEHFIPEQRGGKWNSENINSVPRNPYCHHQFPLPFLIFPVLLTDWGFPGGSDGKDSACNARDPGSIPGSGRSPGEEKGNPLQYSCPENPMDRGAWRATVRGVPNSWTQLSIKLHTRGEWVVKNSKENPYQLLYINKSSLGSSTLQSELQELSHTLGPQAKLSHRQFCVKVLL